MLKTLFISFLVFIGFISFIMIYWWKKNGQKIMDFFNNPMRGNLTKEQSLQELMKLTGSHKDYRETLKKIVKQNKEYEEKQNKNPQ